MTEPPRTSCIDEAAILVATQPGAAERIRRRHRRRTDGHCTGCGPTPTRWPCVQVAIAERASRLRGHGRDHPPEPPSAGPSVDLDAAVSCHPPRASPTP